MYKMPGTQQVINSDVICMVSGSSWGLVNVNESTLYGVSQEATGHHSYCPCPVQPLDLQAAGVFKVIYSRATHQTLGSRKNGCVAWACRYLSNCLGKSGL